MPITARCPRCEMVITADDEAQLVEQVQEHARRDHDMTHTLPAKHVLALLRKQQADTPPNTN